MTNNRNLKNIPEVRKIALILMLILLTLFLSCNKVKVYKVGILNGLSDFLAPLTDGFKEEMETLGYQEGKNIIYDVQKMDVDLAKYEAALKKFIADKVDLILAFPTEAGMVAQQVTKGTDMPVVFDFSLIEGMGIVANIRQPGENVTGVRLPGPDMALKRLEILQKIAPAAKRIAIPYQKGYPIVKPQMDAIQSVALAAGITLIEVPAMDGNEAVALMEEQQKTGLDAILFLAEPLTVIPDTFLPIGQFAYKSKIPLGGGYIKVEGVSSIFGINVTAASAGKKAAPIADKILKGTRPGTIPVVSGDTFFQIDISAARELGVTIPDDVLNQADEIIR